MTRPDGLNDRLSTRPAAGSQSLRGFVLYLAMLVAAVGVFFAIRWIGEGASPAGVVAVDVAPSAPRAAAGPKVDVMLHVLATLAAMVGLGHLLGRLFQKMGQPPVIGEVVAGICLGPSVLGALAPSAMHFLIPPAAADPHGEVATALKVIAQVGVILYMFTVGLELNAAALRRQAHAAIVISHLSIVVPFLLGSMLALWLHQVYAPAGISFTSFSLFMGVAMAITAFPVLARILTDRCMESTPLGMMALACAAADDATAWCLLAVVVGVVKSQVASGLVVTSLAIAFVATMVFGVRPLVQRWSNGIDRTSGPLPTGVLALALIGALISSLAAEVIGIHAIFGAFLLGALIPHESRLSVELTSRLKDSVTILLLPAFFAYTGMRTQIGLVSGFDQWLVCAVIIAVATVGKFGGTFVAAKVVGISTRDSAALGALMNTRGLMELIALNIGYDLGVISPTLFAMMVLMALATTMATAPILGRLVPEFCKREERLRTSTPIV
jgi:Kef-type K+ transport system membrane component KefB